MEIEISQFDFENPKHELAIPKLTEWTGIPDEVLELNEQTIASHPYKLIAFDKKTEELAGYIAITAEFMSEMVKLGGFVTNPDMVNRGSDQALKTMLSEVHTQFPKLEMMTSIVNEKSKRMFEREGAQAVGDLSVYWYFRKVNNSLAYRLLKEQEAIERHKDYYERKKFNQGGKNEQV